MTRPEIEIFLESNPTIEVLQLWDCAAVNEDLEESDEFRVDDASATTNNEADDGFLPSLKLIQISDRGRSDMYGSVIEWLFDTRPELRCVGEDGTWHGGRVSPDLDALIHKYPADDDYFYQCCVYR